MPTFKITLAYDGTEFAGWQQQPDQRTVQGMLESALAQLAGAPVAAVGSGRTDAGVHAVQQVVSCRFETRLEDAVLCRALDALTPDDIGVLEVRRVDDDFHAIRDVRSKRYVYLIDDSDSGNLFCRRYAWRFMQPLDTAAMRAAAELLVGRHDFAAFQSAGSPRQTTVRVVSLFSVRRAGQGGPAQQTEPGQPTTPVPVPEMPMIDPPRLVLQVEADGFLYNMVRNMVGTLVEVGRGKRPPGWVREVLDGLDRRRAGPTAPPHGLYLAQVCYG